MQLNWKRLLNYQAVVKQVPFFLFMAMLAVVYIYNGHTADKLVRNIQRSTRELKDLRNEFKSVKGEALLRSRQSEIRETVRSIGLVELTTEPGILVDSTNESN
ncbi:MAG: FtsL-like putative cell division protein [Flavisolibacter sp.]